MCDISFIIPAYNEEKNIGRCLESILSVMASTSYRYEVIVCDHSSSDSTAEIAKEIGVRVLNIARGGNVSLVRNKGAEIASGATYVFLDADVELTDEWRQGLDAVIDELNLYPLKIVGSFCVPPKDKNYIIENWFVHTTKNSMGYLGTAHMFTTKECFEALRGFEQGLVTGEDYDFCTRCKLLGGSIDVRPEMIVYHHDYPRSISSFLRREAWHGEGDFQSLENICKSKVAILTIIFIFLHLLLFGFLAEPSVFVFQLLIIGAFIFMASFLKFRKLRLLSILKATPVMYMYFLGRSMSLFKVIAKRIKGSSNEVKL